MTISPTCSDWDTVTRVGQTPQSTSPINVECLRLIRESFAQSGMTQDQLTRACGIPRSTLANMLSPTAQPRVVHVGQMIKIAVAMGVDAREWVRKLERFERSIGGTSSMVTVQKRAARRAPGE